MSLGRTSSRCEGVTLRYAGNVLTGYMDIYKDVRIRCVHFSVHRRGMYRSRLPR